LDAIVPFHRESKQPMTGGVADYKGEDTVLGVADVLTWSPTSLRSSGNDGQEGLAYFEFHLRVHALRVEPYEVTVKQAVSDQWIMEHRVRMRFDAQWHVAVRVSKEDRDSVSIALDVDPRFVLVQQRDLKKIKAEGARCEVIVIDADPFLPPMTASNGSQAWHFELTVIPASGDPYRIAGSDVVSPSTLPLVYPGSRLPARVRSTDEPPAIDWDAALGVAPA
jgi:hypothetical protein